ncbi:type II secretion system F family protein [Aquibacillus sp. 3ASR75-11]|uniref:Type II secretion system F family protein n=1 Tax=Terrihalobacillus insolitus TaxID=2950438 RepID=A0A9X4AM29_9BACI|nr:competence type IV pilus assembly protein ComGB [Terrihalobacillus insolitus]MDC3413404.1 type II secretion system F family protein [Terrihalobacillus insolitus]MDC3424987.1 type II secretion system F family protein [Terrihalobacillus insolitus]
MPLALQIKQVLTKPINKRKLTLEEQYTFLHRLHRLIQNGYSLLESLEMISWDTKMAEHAWIIYHDLKTGAPIDKCFEKVHFSDKIVAYFIFARINGDLEKTLERCCLMLQQQMDHMKKFQQTSRYPFILFCFFVLLITFVKTMVYPAFIQLFESSLQSSAVTELSLFLINLLLGGLIGLGSISFFALFVWRFLKSRLHPSVQINIYRKIPIFKKYKSIQLTFMFCTHFGSLLKTGMPIKDALQFLKEQHRLPILSYYASQMTYELERGFHLSSLLSSFALFEKELTTIFQRNANVQLLEKDLTMYSELLTERLQASTKKVIGLIQPLFFILLAGIIIFVYLSIMLPMYNLIQTV